jgi:transcriptional regulator with XRE-family HTH domain
MSVKFGNRLKKARKEKKLTQKQLAESIGINQKQYQHWERGRAEPSFDKVKRLSYVLEINVEWLLYGNGKFIANKEKKTSDLLKTIQLFLKDNPQGFPMLQKMFELFISEYKAMKSK